MKDYPLERTGANSVKIRALISILMGATTVISDLEDRLEVTENRLNWVEEHLLAQAYASEIAPEHAPSSVEDTETSGMPSFTVVHPADASRTDFTLIEMSTGKDRLVGFFNNEAAAVNYGRANCRLFRVEPA